MVDPAQKRGFLIMPFRSDLDWLHRLIVDVSRNVNVETKRGDDIFKPGSILQQVFDEIDAADIVIAVCTDKNPNVFFELGYAWLRHSPILIANSSEDLPFDVAAFRTEMYGGETYGTSRDTLALRLDKTIKAAIATENIPRGRRLTEAPKPKGGARLSSSLQDNGKSHRFVITNTGNVELRNVDVDVPEDVGGGFSLHTNELPIDVLRPGESVRLHASLSFGLKRSIFDIVVRGESPDGEILDFPSKISV